MPGRHEVGRRARAIDGQCALPAGQDVGVRRQRHLGVGRLRRTVLRRTAAAAADERRSRPSTFRTPDFSCTTATKGQIYFRLFSYVRYLNQRNLATTYTDAFGNDPHGGGAAGHAAAQVLRAVRGLVSDAEVPLLPLRLVREYGAGRPGPGRRRRQSQLQLQPVRHGRRGHHVTAVDAQHGGPVSVLARRRRSPDRRRVLPWLLHERRLAQGRGGDEVQVHGDVRQQPEHARRQRGAARQQVRHAVVHGPVAADDRRVRSVGHVRRLRLPREAGDAGGRPLHAQPGRQAEPAGDGRDREHADSPERRQRHLHARICSVPASA